MLEILTTELDILSKIQECTLGIQMHSQYYPNKSWKCFHKDEWNPCYNGNNCLRMPLRVSWNFVSEYILGLKSFSFSVKLTILFMHLPRAKAIGMQDLSWWCSSDCILETQKQQISAERRAKTFNLWSLISLQVCRWVFPFHSLVEGARPAKMSVFPTGHPTLALMASELLQDW